MIIYEAQLIGFKEALKACLVWLVFFTFLAQHEKRTLARPFYAGLIAAVVIAILSLLVPRGFFTREYISNTISMSFALFLLFSGASLFHLSGINLFGGRDITAVLRKPLLTSLIVFITTVIFFAPDSAGSLFYLRELALMKETQAGVYLSFFLGMIIAVLITFAFFRLYRPYWIGSFFHLPQLFLFLAMVKLLGSGIRGVAELSLLPAVQRGFMKFTHDFIHQTFVFLMVPDHPLLKTTVWNFIAFFFGANFASYVSLFILLFFPLIFLYHSLARSLPEPDAPGRAQKRKIKSLMLSDRRKKALPILFFIVFILFGWFSQSQESVTQIYVPKPKPVVVDRGYIVIPLKDPTMDLMDGLMHTFSLLHEGQEIRILIIRKTDNSLSVCLDACEICPPDGYGQRGDRVICLYCETPIAIVTLGQPGGCNPIPLEAQTDDQFVRIELQEILRKWGFVESGTHGRQSGEH